MLSLLDDSRQRGLSTVFYLRVILGEPFSVGLCQRILADLAGAGGEAFEIAPADDPDDLAQLDAAWEEEQVRFDTPLAPGSDNCPKVGAILDRMLDPALTARPSRSL